MLSAVDIRVGLGRARIQEGGASAYPEGGASAYPEVVGKPPRSPNICGPTDRDGKWTRIRRALGQRKSGEEQRCVGKSAGT
jgi:hypothetical protein